MREGLASSRAHSWAIRAQKRSKGTTFTLLIFNKYDFAEWLGQHPERHKGKDLKVASLAQELPLRLHGLSHVPLLHSNKEA